MSTRSRIGIIRSKPEGEAPVVESIYCHFDGYPEGVGQTLLDHWADEDKINELLALGDLSVLGSVIGEKHDFDSHTGTFVGGRPHDHPDGYAIGEYVEGEATRLGWCLAYGRDRGEERSGPIKHSLRDWPDYGQEAEYVFDPDEGKWWVSSPGQNPVGWNTVTPWHGFISIPDAIELERKLQAEYEEAHA